LKNGVELGDKAERHRYVNLRAGAIKTEKGWSVVDFASSFFNPNSEEITVAMTMISDDPKFVFTNGQVGTYTKSYKLRPMQGTTDNIYIGSPKFGKPEWPVAPLTDFIGSIEFISSQPFYYYLLTTGIGEASDATDAYFAAWKPWRDTVRAAWDLNLRQFVIPYTNYWHNENNWPVGWHSVLTLKNQTDQPVTYTVKHIPYYGGQFNPKDGKVTRYQEQVVHVILQKGEEKKVTLQELFGWAADQMSSMEGCLLISPNCSDAKTGTAIELSVVPNDSGEPLHEFVS
jgi:hypothetical protein